MTDPPQTWCSVCGIHGCSPLHQRLLAVEAHRDDAVKEAAKLREALSFATERFAAYFAYHGADHEDPGCPEDDGCECPLVVGVNDAFRKAKAALKGPGE